MLFGRSAGAACIAAACLLGASSSACAAADLTVTALSGTASAAAGETVSFTDTVRNGGSAAAGNFSVVYYLSDTQDPAGASVWEYLVERAVYGLEAGLSDADSISFSVPAVATGTYYVIAVADGASEVAEDDEENNSLAQAFSVTASGGGAGETSGPDLAVTTVTVPVSAQAGAWISVNATVRNAGDAAAAAFTVYFYLSADAVLSAADALLGSRGAPALAPGASSTGQTSVTVPYAGQGDYYVIAVASSSETDQADNALASAGMSVVNDADLRVTTVTAPVSAGVSQTVIVTDTVKNDGAVVTAGTFKVGYYLSTDGVFSPASDLLLGYRTVSSLAAGASSSGSRSVTVPSAAPGEYFVIAVADAQGAIAETDEEDNALAAAQPLTVANALDLIVTTVSAPASAVIGETVLLSATVSNLGDQSAGTFRVGWYLSADASYSDGDALLGYRTVASLEGGQSDAGSVSVTLSSAVPVGTYYVIAAADTLGAVAETAEENNAAAAASPMNVTNDLDLAVTAVSGPSVAALGETITVQDTVRNDGTSSTGTFLVGYYLSTDGLYSGSDLLLGYRTVAALAGGAADLGSASVVVPVSAATGSYHLIAVADPLGSVSETEEGNNALAATSLVLLREDADLLLSTVTAPAEAFLGAAMTVAYEVRNAGLGAAGAFGVSFYLSTDDALSVGGDVFLGSRTVAGLAAAAAAPGLVSVPVPTVARGQYYLIGAVDAAGTIVEADEGNNALTGGELVRIRLPVPGTPGKPAGQVLGVSSITWQWSAAAAAGTYLVHCASAPTAPLAELAGLQTVQEGLTPNASGSIRVTAVNADGPGAASEYSDPLYTLANPPAGIAAPMVAVTSASLSWGLNSNAVGTLAEVQRSTDGTSYVVVRSSPVTGTTETGLRACTPYWYRVRNRNGDGLATAFAAVDFQTGASTPTPPNLLSARSLTDRRIALSWQPSTAEEVVQYRLYYDQGTGVIAYGTPLAVFSSTETGWVTGALASSAAYAFGLRAVNRCGVEEGNTGVTASAGAVSSLTGVRAAVTSPLAGQKVWGTRVTAAAELVLGEPARTLEVRFQYRPAGAAAWTDLPAAGASHPNPAVQPPYFVHWDAQSLGAGAYELRAVAAGVSSGADAAPPGVGVVVDPADPDIVETVAQKQQRIDNAIANTVAAGDGTSQFFSRLDIPSGALSAATATVTLVDNPVLKPAPPRGAEDLGLTVQVSLSNGQTQFSGGRTVMVTLSYPDADGDGVVDGSSARVDRLRMYTAGTAAGPWARVAASRDSGAKTFSGATPHFSFFALFAAAADDLGSVRVYPNPFKPNSGNADYGVPYAAGDPNSGIIFDNLPGAADVRIFTLTGQAVARFGSAATGGRLQWDAKNDRGRDAASGLYFAVITSPDRDRVVRKVLIAR